MNIDLRCLRARCSCDGPHLKVEGRYTKASATYVPLRVQALADSFFEAIQAVTQKRTDELDLEVVGLENQLVNEVALSSAWDVHSQCSFKKESHINILEEATILRLVNFLSRERRPLRAVALVDNYVLHGAISKGRSSSVTLSAVLRRVNAMCVTTALFGPALCANQMESF